MVEMLTQTYRQAHIAITEVSGGDKFIVVKDRNAEIENDDLSRAEADNILLNHNKVIVYYKDGSNEYNFSLQ